MNHLNVIKNHKELKLHGIHLKKKENKSCLTQYFIHTNLNIITIHFGKEYGSFLIY